MYRDLHVKVVKKRVLHNEKEKCIIMKKSFKIIVFSFWRFFQVPQSLKYC